MTDEADLYILLRGLEESLMRPAIRADSAAVALLLEDDFVEIGKSGRTYDKAAILSELRRETETEMPAMENFAVCGLSVGVVLVTYRTVRRHPGGFDVTMRSSIWRRHEESWRLRFHQGTPIVEA